jgi:D-alanine-D-alanine ligase
MLELLGIPYTGSGPLALATCLNKVMVKAILMHHEIPTAKYQVFNSRYKKLDPELRFPLIVKPASTDASIGISNNAIVRNEEQLRSRVGYVLRSFNQSALVEEFMPGREFTASIIGNDKSAEVLPICEVVFRHQDIGRLNICDYDSKWNKSDTYDSVCPAPVPKYLENKLKKIAMDTHRVLGTRDYSRVDIRLDENNNPCVLEMNPNPGISADSFLPFSAEMLKVNYKEMINIIFNCALDRCGITNDKKVSILSDFITGELSEESYVAAEKTRNDLIIKSTLVASAA